LKNVREIDFQGTASEKWDPLNVERNLAA